MRSVENAEELARVDAAIVDLFGRLGTVFDRHPALAGFSVQEHDTLTKDRFGARLDAGLSIADVSLELFGHDTAPALCDLVEVLAPMLDENPGLAQLLRGRTFARTLH